MHAFCHELANRRITIHHHGDYSGNVEIVVDSSSEVSRMEIPFEAIKAFFVEYLREQLIDKIEDLSDNDVIKHFF